MVTEDQIKAYIFEHFYDRLSGPNCDKFYLIVNFKDNTIIEKPEEHDLKPRERIYSFYKENGGGFLTLEDQY
jgi:hypothetical protein